ncbi:Os01g0228901 [Oryza sativa Japonica Group]|uniref:Os01g0228901 protein n=1 Tax=Oryza sativa subsp. japonica TaxID=39947 RepID=A0A0P0UZX0_ORYSJ|nr:hypothetical protein EE612_001219 [Oryza sativa]BAS71148.1 Os01g0228901 [Oryza sativa Japonica Group]
MIFYTTNSLVVCKTRNSWHFIYSHVQIQSLSKVLLQVLIWIQVRGRNMAMHSRQSRCNSLRRSIACLGTHGRLRIMCFILVKIRVYLQITAQWHSSIMHLGARNLGK